MNCPKGTARSDWASWACTELGRDTGLPASGRSGLPSIVTASWRRDQLQRMWRQAQGQGRDERHSVAGLLNRAPSLALALRPSEPARELALCV
jgi:hypothetical protein